MPHTLNPEPYTLHPTPQGDVAYTAPGDTHQLRHAGGGDGAGEPFGFICVVATDRDRPVEVDPKVGMCGLNS
jgi:hypothetical protein